MSQAQKDRARSELKKMHEQRMAKLTYFEVNGLREVKPDAANSMVTLARSSASDFKCTSNEIDYFIRRDMSNVTMVEPQNMFGQEKLVILQGISGSGKTNLCHALIIEWQAGRLWENRYDFVFLVNVHDLMNSMSEGPFTLARALHVLYSDVFKHITFQDLRNFRYLIIVDSLDKCNVDKISSDCAAGEASIENVIKELLTLENHCDRLVLGTPRSCQKMRQTVLKDSRVQYLDVLGFSEEQVLEYVLKFCQADKRRAGILWQLINENRSMLGYARLPLFANVICNVLCANAMNTIETRTELFLWAYTVYQTRHLQKYWPFVEVSSHEKLFGYEILMNALTRLGRMAYDNLSTGKTFFDPDEFFNATELESVLITPFLHRQQQTLSFVHEFFIEFFAAIHLFVSRMEIDDNIVRNPRLRRVLPILFGLLGGASENPKSQKIVLDFVKLLMEKFSIAHITKHPVCSISKALSATDKYFYITLCFELQNSDLLNDAGMHWDSNAVLAANHHDELDGIIFFLRYFRQGDGPINQLSILPQDRTLSITECLKLSESTSSCSKLNTLRLQYIEVNLEMMRILSPTVCATPTVVFKSIRTTSVDCWGKLHNFVQDAHKCQTLRLHTLWLDDCDFNNEMMNKLSPVICLMSNVRFESIRTTSAECWAILNEVVQDAHNKNRLRLHTLWLDDCDLNNEMMNKLSPVICLMSSVWFKSIRTTSAECWEILNEVVQDAHNNNGLRLHTLWLNDCDLNNEMMNKLSPVICLMSNVWLELIRTTSAECWEILNEVVQDAHNKNRLRLHTLWLDDCDLNNEMMNKLSPVICLMSTVWFKSIRSTSAVCWEILNKVVQDAHNNNKLRLETLGLNDCDLNNEMMNKLSPVICLMSTVRFESIRTTSEECWETLHKAVQNAYSSKRLRIKTIFATGINVPMSLAGQLKRLEVMLEC